MWLDSANKSRSALFVVTATATVIAAEVATKIILAVVEFGDLGLIAGCVARVVVIHIVGVGIGSTRVGALVPVAVEKSLTAGRAATARAAADIVKPEVAGEVAIAAATAAAPGSLAT